MKISAPRRRRGGGERPGKISSNIKEYIKDFAWNQQIFGKICSNIKEYIKDLMKLLWFSDIVRNVHFKYATTVKTAEISISSVRRP